MKALESRAWLYRWRLIAVTANGLRCALAFGSGHPGARHDDSRHTPGVRSR